MLHFGHNLTYKSITLSETNRLQSMKHILVHYLGSHKETSDLHMHCMHTEIKWDVLEDNISNTILLSTPS